jgi:Ca2+-binding RTX toxin-like protein
VTVTALQVDPQNADETALAVGGTTGSDRLHVSRRGRRHDMDVRLNRDRLDVETPSGHLLVYAQDGNDVILVNGSVSLPSVIDAGAGNDFVRAGAGDDIVLGRAGNDVLFGGRGRDLLVGGSGRDLIMGGSGDDILIGGQVSFVEEQKSLRNIMAEWTSDRLYSERVANLQGDETNPAFADRANKDSYLTFGGPNATVLDDGERHILTGAAGRDWFFANLDDDLLTDLDN